MNIALIVIVIALWFFFGYRIYGNFIEKKLKISDKNKTPASKNNKNKIDFSPSNQPFLIGHHFASIAGAGPIIGPILAVSYFGWLPVIIWIAIGAVFIGAMHDFVTLIASVRNDAKGVSSIAKSYLGSRAAWIFSFMIWITLVLIITVFSVSAAESLIKKPDLVIPLITISVVAFIIGIGVQKLKWNYKLASFIALILIILSIFIGYLNPINLPFEGNALKIAWITIIIGYAGLASVIPINLLLRPRDFLSAIQMILILILGFLSILIVRPVINAPTYISGSTFPIWPILFITVACGAISGFHGLVSSGTSSKQLSKESHGKSVGYGSMLLEGTLAVFVTLVVISGLSWVGEGSFRVTLEQGWIVLFSSGFGNIVSSVGIPFIGFGVASLLGGLMVNQFILTTVDASARIGRIVIGESLVTKIKNRFLLTFITIVPAWMIAVTNSYETLWRLFGTSNQLIASISLICVSAFFIKSKVNVKFIVIPSLFVLITTLSSLFYLIFRDGGYFVSGNYVLAIISIAMFSFGLFAAYEGLKNLKTKGN